MPAFHDINHKQKLIVTTWEGEPTSQDLAKAYRGYLNTIKNNPELEQYNELVDFSLIKGLKLNSNGLRMLADLAASSDTNSVKTRLGIVVNSYLTFGLARMYEIYRNLNPKKNKEIKVFHDKSSSLDWINNSS